MDVYWNFTKESNLATYLKVINVDFYVFNNFFVKKSKSVSGMIGLQDEIRQKLTGKQLFKSKYTLSCGDTVFF